MNLLMLETALSERDVAALHEWQEQQRKRVAEAEAERDHLRRALKWLAGEFKWLVEPRVHSVEQIVVSALTITEEPA